MFFRIRTRLADRPGSLARIVSRCGTDGLNVMALQIFPEVDSVTDEIVLRAPEGWTVAEVGRLVASAGGTDTLVAECGVEVLVDQPTRWLAAAREVGEQPGLLPRLIDELLPLDRSLWSPTEHARAELLAELARHGAEDDRSEVTYSERSDSVVAIRGGVVLGTAVLLPGVAGSASVAVPSAWRRDGIGTELVRRIAALATRQGHSELMLVGAVDDRGLLEVLETVGLRGIVRLSRGSLTVRVRLVARPAVADSA